jgi:hypothetical protein
MTIKLPETVRRTHVGLNRMLGKIRRLFKRALYASDSQVTVAPGPALTKSWRLEGFRAFCVRPKHYSGDWLQLIFCFCVA